MIILKLRICSSGIGSFVDCWVWYTVDVLESGGQSAADHVGQLLKVRKKLASEKAKKSTTTYVQNLTYVGNTKEIDLY